MTALDPTDPTRFEEMYRDDRLSHGLPTATPWDIGGPQPVVQQLVAYGGVRGEVLDPGTGPGYHAIQYASKGYSAIGSCFSARLDRPEKELDRVPKMSLCLVFGPKDAEFCEPVGQRLDQGQKMLGGEFDFVGFDVDVAGFSVLPKHIHDGAEPWRPSHRLRADREFGKAFRFIHRYALKPQDLRMSGAR